MLIRVVKRKVQTSIPPLEKDFLNNEAEKLNCTPYKLLASIIHDYYMEKKTYGRREKSGLETGNKEDSGRGEQADPGQAEVNRDPFKWSGDPYLQAREWPKAPWK